MAELRPTEASLRYLLGDDLRADDGVKSLNAELGGFRESGQEVAVWVETDRDADSAEPDQEDCWPPESADCVKVIDRQVNSEPEVRGCPTRQRD